MKTLIALDWYLMAEPQESPEGHLLGELLAALEALAHLWSYGIAPGKPFVLPEASNYVGAAVGPGGVHP